MSSSCTATWKTSSIALSNSTKTCNLRPQSYGTSPVTFTVNISSSALTGTTTSSVPIDTRPPRPLVLIWVGGDYCGELDSLRSALPLARAWGEEGYFRQLMFDGWLLVCPTKEGTSVIAEIWGIKIYKFINYKEMYLWLLRVNKSLEH